ncbi:MAG: hypothetical protein HY706_20695 [Candidatus Hydrogenedentes bacterium]|nr:hypothetical protein [Candidatus Hydrogenedentota bacterium]
MKLHPDRAQAAHRRRGLDTAVFDEWLGLHERSRFAAKYLRDARGNPWTPRHYQVVSLESYAPRKVHCDGRDVGKTAEIEIVAVWAAVVCRRSEMLIATQCENHLYPLMDRVVRRIESLPRLGVDLLDIKRTPFWHLRFSNGFVLWGRIAGPRGINFQGLHVDWQLIDEAQEMTDTAWGELYQALNSGGRRWMYGVPNGLRNTFYRMTQMQDAEQYNWPSSFHPDFTPVKDAELALLYGGRESPGYLHRVLGQHGTPEYAVFNLDHYLACVDEALDFDDIQLTERDSFEPPTAVTPGEYYLGCDLGYARDPSEFVVYRADEPHFANVLRVHLRGVNYAKQQDVIMALDRAYDFRAIGIDCGNNGRAVAHNLMAQGEDWCDKVRAFEFGASLELEPLPDGSPHRRPVKQFMTELLERRMLERSIVFPRLPDREAQYASHTYAVGSHGQIHYEKGNDHLIDADRCAILAYYLDTHYEEPPPRIGVRVETF